MTATSSSTASTTPSTTTPSIMSSSSTPTRRRIVVDASKLRHGPAVDDEGTAHAAALMYADSDTGCIVGVVLAACGVPADDMVGDAIYYGDHWPDFLPVEWHDDWKTGLPRTKFSKIVEAFDRGFEPTAANKLIELFEGAGVELVFEGFPDEVQVVDETDRRPS